MYKKKTLILTLILSLLIPLTVFSILEENGAFDTRSQAESQLLEQFKVADIDGNGRVDLNDFDIWLQMWKGYKANKSEYSHRGDIDGDGLIGISDFAIWLEKWRGYKVYTANPETYGNSPPEGLLATLSLDQQAGSGYFLKDISTDTFNGVPIGTEYLSYGAFGSSRLIGLGDSIDINNGSKLNSTDYDSVFSFWVNMFDESMFDLGSDPNLFAWDDINEKFTMISMQDIDMDLSALVDIFESVDIEAMILPEHKGWFNLIAFWNSEDTIIEYYVNGESIGNYNFDHNDIFQDTLILSLFPQDSEVAIDNIQVWGGGSDIDVETIYANDEYTENIPDEQIEIEDSNETVELPEGYTYQGKTSVLAGKNCSACSSKYMYIKIFWDDGTQDNVCAESSDEERFAVDDSAVYLCARCEDNDGVICNTNLCPTVDDSNFAQHYYAGKYYDETNLRYAYDIYTMNCIDDRTDKGCKPLNACPNTNYRQCSIDFLYAIEVFDSADSTGNSVFRCNCLCDGSNGASNKDLSDMNSTNKWNMGRVHFSYENCVKVCEDPDRMHIPRY